jgi:hypothetical protein
MRTPSLSLSAISAISAVLALAPSAPAADDVFVDLSISSALARAEKGEQIVILYFHEEENPASRRMLTSTFGDEMVQAWLSKHAVTLKVPITDLKACARFNIDSAPFTVLLRPDAGVLHRMDGFKDTTDFLIDAQIAIIGLGEVKEPEGEDAHNPVAWLAWANWLFANAPQKADDCAAAYFWCLDQGEEHMPGFRARHIEFLLERISYLKGRTADAIDGLIVRRRNLQGRMIGGIATPLEAYEYCRYNWWMRDQFVSVETFVNLSEYDTEAHEACRQVVFEQELKRIVDHRHYDLVLELAPDPLAQIDQRLRAYIKQTAEGSKDLTSRSRIVDDAASYYECLLHAGRGADAKELIDRVTGAVSTGRTYFAFLERAQRLELYELAHQIADMGLEKVTTPKGKKMLERAKLRIPEKTEPSKGTTPIPTKGDKGDGGR